LGRIIKKKKRLVQVKQAVRLNPHQMDIKEGHGPLGPRETEDSRAKSHASNVVGLRTDGWNLDCELKKRKNTQKK